MKPQDFIFWITLAVLVFLFICVILADTRKGPRKVRKRKGPGIKWTIRDFTFLIIGIIIGGSISLALSFVYHVVNFLIKL